MKRHGNLWEQVISFEALLRAAEQARKGKRFRPAVAAFHFDQERALWKLHEELTTKTYRPGAYRSFFIYEPKKRQISAAPYRDRVVHHALVNVLEPIYERTFIADSYACRKGKGTHAAVRPLPGVRPPLPLCPESRHPEILSHRWTTKSSRNCGPQDQRPGRAVARGAAPARPSRRRKRGCRPRARRCRESVSPGPVRC